MSEWAFLFFRVVVVVVVGAHFRCGGGEGGGEEAKKSLEEEKKTRRPFSILDRRPSRKPFRRRGRGRRRRRRRDGSFASERGEMYSDSPPISSSIFNIYVGLKAGKEDRHALRVF